MSIGVGRHTRLPDDVSCNCRLEIGHFCSIASGLRIVSGQHPAVDHPLVVSNFPFAEHRWDDRYPPSRHEGKVSIGSDVWIGEGVTILDGVRVNHGAVLGAGAVVAKDVDPYAVVVGNPAHVVRMRFSEIVVRELLRVSWWEWSDDKIKARLKDMANVNTFLGLA